MAGDWTFLSNHGHVIVLLSREPDARVRDVAQRVGITERAVRAIVADLVEGGYLKVTKVGRRNHYRVMRRPRLRHPEESQQSIGALLDLFPPT